MSNSDWIEADRIDRLKPLAQWAYGWCISEMDLKLEPPERYFSIREVEWDQKSNKVLIRVTTWNSKYPQRFDAHCLEEVAEKLGRHKIAIPESLAWAVCRERRLRVSEETLDYWLNSGNSVY